MAQSEWEAVTAVINSLPLGYAERDSHELGQEFTYGELTVEGVAAILQDAHARRASGNGRPVQCFLDLGSGTGKTVLAAAALFPMLEHAIGVELSKPRHKIASEGREALASSAVANRLLDRVTFIHGDACRAVAAIAAADVIWVSNTCFPDSLNSDLGVAIDDYARQGALVYCTRDIGFKRRLEGNASLVSCKVTWSLNHHAASHEVVGRPCASSQLGGDSVVGTPTEQAFARWAVPVRLSGKHLQQKGKLRWLLQRDTLLAAVAHALLPSVSAVQLVEDLYMEDGALLEICTEALADASLDDGDMKDVLAATDGVPDESEGGLDFDAFEEVCNQYLEIVHGTWTWRLNRFLNCAMCGR